MIPFAKFFLRREDNCDEVCKLFDMPWPSVGAPCPQLFIEDGRLLLAYYVETSSSDGSGFVTTKMVTPHTVDEQCVLVEFIRHSVSVFGPPNDEAFAGHPLAKKGLHPYGVFEIRNSSWIRKLERMNAVHPRHSAELYSMLRHFVFTFHDSTFECIAHDFRFKKSIGSVRSVLMAAAAL